MSARSKDSWGVKGSRRRAPTPPPRDPSGINSIVQHVGEERQEGNPAAAYRQLDCYDSESSESSSCGFARKSKMDTPKAQKRSSSYENVSAEDAAGFYPNKPPPAVVVTPRRCALSRTSPVETTTHRSTPSPVPKVYPQHFQHHHYNVNPPRNCVPSPCPSSDSVRCSSRHNSPVRHMDMMDTYNGRWTDMQEESTDSGEAVRRRPPPVCKAPRSHRGSMPPGDYMGPAWGQHASCSCCSAAALRYHWCGGTASPNWNHCSLRTCSDQNYDCDDLQVKISQLEMEKEQLALQVNVLSEQVEAQNEKIVELEMTLSKNKEQLNNSEALLRQEITTRSSVENAKLDLLSQVSALRSRLATVEHEKHEVEERNNKLESELILTCACLAEKEADLATLKSRIARNGSITPVKEIDSEVEKLKGALFSVIAVNSEKDKKIQEMKTSLNRYKKLQELVYSNTSGKVFDPTGVKKVPLFEEIALYDIDISPELPFENRLTDKPPPAPRQFQHCMSSSLSLYEDFNRSSSRLAEISRQSPLHNIFCSESPVSHRINSIENIGPPTPQKTPPAKRHYSTLPRPNGSEIVQQYLKSPTAISSPFISGQTSQSHHNLHHPSLESFRPIRSKASAGMSFGKGFFKLRSGKRSSSAPELAPERPEVVETPKYVHSHRRTSSPLNVSEAKEKPKGFKKIFGKIKRTGSENIGMSEAEFKRGGIRATAGPRLGWSREKINRESFKVVKPFIEWDCSMICDWLISIGLDMYVLGCKKSIKSGDQLLKTSTHDFEKELGIKNPLHRKKLLLAINGAKMESGDIVEPAGKIDHNWVTRWLDDIGLPHYKDAFYDARIDGRMLHHLTLDDLSYLKVTNQLHLISMKTGIQVLRGNNFNPLCLIRRSFPNEENRPSEVSKWTNHRVMEWLKIVDLSEYAPNLRGSGVHGGIMLYEPRFNADLLASLLNIPPNKTLLRRHLSTQFKQLVGPDIMQKKREWEAQPSYSPLSPSAKIKAVRKGHFSLIRRKKNDMTFEDYVCPMNFTEKMFGSVSLSNGLQTSSDEEKFLMKEIVLKNESILDEMPASNV